MEQQQQGDSEKQTATSASWAHAPRGGKWAWTDTEDSVAFPLLSSKDISWLVFSQTISISHQVIKSASSLSWSRQLLELFYEAPSAL